MWPAFLLPVLKGWDFSFFIKILSSVLNLSLSASVFVYLVTSYVAVTARVGTAESKLEGAIESKLVVWHISFFLFYLQS